MTASRLLVAVSARSLAEVEERVTLPQFRMLVVLATRGATKPVTRIQRPKGDAPAVPVPARSTNPERSRRLVVELDHGPSGRPGR